MHYADKFFVLHNEWVSKWEKAIGELDAASSTTENRSCDVPMQAKKSKADTLGTIFGRFRFKEVRFCADLGTIGTSLELVSRECSVIHVNPGKLYGSPRIEPVYTFASAGEVRTALAGRINGIMQCDPGPMFHFVRDYDTARHIFERLQSGHVAWQQWLHAKEGLNYFAVEIPVLDFRLAQSVQVSKRAKEKYVTAAAAILKNPQFLRNLVLSLEIALLQLRWGDVARDTRSIHRDAEMHIDETVWDLGVEMQSILRCQTFLMRIASESLPFISSHVYFMEKQMVSAKRNAMAFSRSNSSTLFKSSELDMMKVTNHMSPPDDHIQHSMSRWIRRALGSVGSLKVGISSFHLIFDHDTFTVSVGVDMFRSKVMVTRLMCDLDVWIRRKSILQFNNIEVMGDHYHIDRDSSGREPGPYFEEKKTVLWILFLSSPRQYLR